jgi:predicted Rossmann fold flavoprotein
MQISKKKVAIIGGGAAGFFAAIELATLRPDLQIDIYEKSQQVLSKVKISGGGRCNVTHACFDPKELVTYYPRGKKELRGPFSKFGPGDTIQWFEQRGVELKTESDGRMFPITDSSQTIIDTFIDEVERLKIRVHLQKGLTGLSQKNNEWQLQFSDNTAVNASAVLIASGSSSMIWELLSGLGLEIIPPVPSLFTFHVRDKKLQALSGLSVEFINAAIVDSSIETEGPVLITHWGFSGPAILKLSAWGARILKDKDYKFSLTLDYLPARIEEVLIHELKELRKTESRKQVNTFSPYHELPKRLWNYLTLRSGIPDELNWADLSNTHLQRLVQELKNGMYEVSGKSTFKDEFVTCGGVALSEIDFKTYSSSRIPGLFFGGEVIDVDAVTGGFNFQHAWTSGHLAAKGIDAYLP